MNLNKQKPTNTAKRNKRRNAGKPYRTNTSSHLRFSEPNSFYPGKSPQELLAIVAKSLSMKVDCFSLKCRSRNIAELRFIGTLLLRRHFPYLTLQEIARLYGGTDHTSVLYGLKRGAVLLTIRDTEFTKKYQTALQNVHAWVAAT